jgi:hypothetical protein
MRIAIGDRNYFAGRSKASGKYVLKAWRKTGWHGIGEFDKADQLKDALAHLRRLADKREARSMIADMCGTSYRAAMADMGMSRI